MFIAHLEKAGRMDRALGERTGDPLSHGYVRQAVAAIGYRHTINGYPSPADHPVVRQVLDGHAKTHGTDHDGKDPIRIAGLARITETLAAPHPTAARDLAMALLATDPRSRLTAGALARLDGEHVLFPDRIGDPMIVLVGRRGTTALDPLEIPASTDTAICPVGALRALAPEPLGPVFRSSSGNGRLSTNGAAAIVRRTLAAAGITATGSVFTNLAAAQRRRIGASVHRPRHADVRDRALILNLYWGCFRASELTGRRWGDLRIVDEGTEWTIPRDKTNQDGRRHRVTGVPRHTDPWMCPVIALEEWAAALEELAGRRVTERDPVFPALDRRTRLAGAMSVDAAGLAVKAAAERAGLAGNYSSHSLRSGFATDAIEAGATREHVQHHGGWRSIKSLDPYIRRANLWATANPAYRLMEPPDTGA